MSTAKLYNLEYLHELDSNEYLIEMLELFFESTSEMLEEIDKNIRSKNWDEVSKKSHKLKSSLGPLQISKMLDLATAIEENAKHSSNLIEIPALNREMREQYGIVKPMIEAELTKAKKISNSFVSA